MILRRNTLFAHGIVSSGKIARAVALLRRNANPLTGMEPTPVLRAEIVRAEGAEFWIKNDGATHPLYGGNKVRKLEALIEEAHGRGAGRLLTIGAAGSHHVLTTTLFARAAGLAACAVVFPQPASEHVRATLRAALAQGLDARPVRSAFGVLPALLAAYRSGDYFIPPGGSNVLGACAYAQAAQELKLQVAAGALPEPDWIVVPVGSGGTCAGLLAGVIASGLKSRLFGVEIVGNALARPWLLLLARRALQRLGRASSSSELSGRLHLSSSYVGRGYGQTTPAAERAATLAQDELRLALDATYTAKAFAGALDLVAGRTATAGARPGTVLYWHTLSDRPLEPLLAGADAHVLESQLAGVLRVLGLD